MHIALPMRPSAMIRTLRILALTAATSGAVATGLHAGEIVSPPGPAKPVAKPETRDAATAETPKTVREARQMSSNTSLT